MSIGKVRNSISVRTRGGIEMLTQQNRPLVLELRWWVGGKSLERMKN